MNDSTRSWLKILNDDDGNIFWFDVQAAKSWEEDTYFNGNNLISRATQDQWEHERLYCSRLGNWVLERWSQRAGTDATYIKITPEEAVLWLIANNHSLPESLISASRLREV